LHQLGRAVELRLGQARQPRRQRLPGVAGRYPDARGDAADPPAAREVRPAPGIEKALIGQVQRPRGQVRRRRRQGHVAGHGRPAPHRQQLPAEQFPADQDLQGRPPRLGIRTAVTAVPRGQVGRQGDAAGVFDDDRGEAPQQAQAGGARRLHAAQGLRDQGLEEGVRGRPHPPVQGLRREVQADGEGLQGGAGLVDPAEDQGLGEVGGGERAAALDQAGGPAGGVGGSGKQGVQGGGQSCYSRHGELLP
jgi:hypothetical protein